MKLNCEIMEAIQRDFNALWRCQESGETLEISVPYLRPDSALWSISITQRGDRIIVCDGGGVMELLSEYCPLPPDETLLAVREFAGKFGVREGVNEGAPLFFKECKDQKIISSLVFDLSNFAVMATSALVSSSADDDLATPREKRFESKADEYIRSIKPASLSMSKTEIQEVPGFRFSAVLKSTSKIWLVSYVSGSDFSHFRKNLNDTAKSFQHVWKSPISDLIARTIPLLNNDAMGYVPDKLGWYIDDLRQDAHGDLVSWTDRAYLEGMFNLSNRRI